MKSFITRKKVGKQYHYFKKGQRITDELEVTRINSLVIPPAWRKVEIATAKSAKVQAKGYDAAGRQQSIYHPTFRLKQDKKKFDRILRFAERLPGLRKRLDKDLNRRRLSKSKVLATIVTLIDEAYFRVGNDKYAKEHQTYGVTTLRSKHADISRTTVTFDFVGKSGKEHVKTITNPKLVAIIKKLHDLPGQEIFRYQDKAGTMHDLHAGDVNAYIKKYLGKEFSAKDFRTWGGTLLATSAIIKDTLDPDASQTARKKAVTDIVKRVAKRLGNTPAIARSSYIDPRVLVAFDDGVTLLKLRDAMATMRPKKYLDIEEQCVLKLLEMAK